MVRNGLHVLCTLEEQLPESQTSNRTPRKILVSSCDEWGCVSLTIPDYEGNGSFIVKADDLEKAIQNAKNH